MTANGEAGSPAGDAKAHGVPASGNPGSAVAVSPGPGYDGDPGQATLLELASVLLKRWKLLVLAPLITAVIAAGVAFLLPPTFIATASFVGDKQEPGNVFSGSVTGLASRLGIALPGAGSSAHFYADVLNSMTLRNQVLSARYADPRTLQPGDSASLLTLQGVEGNTEAERLAMGRKAMRDKVSIGVDDQSGILSVSVGSRYPALAAAVANEFVSALNRFNLETRQSSVQLKRRFIEGRLATGEEELHVAEGRLQRFLEQNREFRGSPQLEVEYERLQRQVAIKQEVLLTLHREYEAARIQEVNDQPVITVVDQAVPPVEKSKPHRRLIVAVAAFLAAVASTIWAFARELLENARQRGDSDYEELSRRWRDTKRQISTFFRRRPPGLPRVTGRA